MLDRSRPPFRTPADSRLRIGDFVLDPRSRELRHDVDARVSRLSAKAQHVLQVLAQHAGEVLTREQLMDAVWPDSFPTGDVLTQAVVQIRRAFGDDADAPRYLETVAKSGYRLLVPVAPLAAPVRAEPPPDGAEPTGVADTAALAPPDARRSQRKRIALAGAGALVVLLALAAGWRETRRVAGAGLPDTLVGAVRLTSDPRDERMPALSPDGRRVAFSAAWSDDGSTAIRVQASDEFESRALSRPPPAAVDAWASWAPDGNRIAFRRVLDDGRCELYVVSLIAAREQRLGDCDARELGLAWTGAGDALLTGGQRPDDARGGLRRFDLREGTWRALEYAGRSGEWETLPRPSPDGRRIAFLRGYALVDVMLLDVAGARVTRVTQVPGDIRGLAWIDDAQLLVAWNDQHRNGFRILDVASGAMRDIATDGPVQQPSIAAGRVAWHVPVTRYRLLRARLGGDDRSLSPVLRSSTGELLPAAAADGTLAFYSDRSGELAVWIAPSAADDGAPRPVVGLQPIPRFAPVWANDAQRLWVAGHSAAGDGVHAIDAASGRVERLDCAGLDVRHAFPIGADRLGILHFEDERQSLAIFDLGCTRRLVARSLPDVGYARHDAKRDRLLLTRTGQRGLWSVDPALRSLVLLRPNLIGPPMYRAFEPHGDHVYYLARGRAPYGTSLWRSRLDVEDHRDEPVLTGLPPTLVPGFALAADAGTVWFSDATEDARDVWTAPLSRD